MKYVREKMIVAAASEWDMGKALRMKQRAGCLSRCAAHPPTLSAVKSMQCAFWWSVLLYTTAGHNKIYWVQCCQRVQRCSMLHLLLLFFCLAVATVFHAVQWCGSAEVRSSRASRRKRRETISCPGALVLLPAVPQYQTATCFYPTLQFLFTHWVERWWCMVM